MQTFLPCYPIRNDSIANEHSQQEFGLFVHANGDFAKADPVGRGADKWELGEKACQGI